MVPLFTPWTNDAAWRCTEDGLERVRKGEAEHLPWSSFTAGGLLVPESLALPAGLPRGFLPGLGLLLDSAEDLARAQRTLVLSRGTSPLKAVRVQLAPGDEVSPALARQRLGDRWVGELTRRTQSKSLGWTYPLWFILAVLAGFVVFAWAILLAAGAVWSLSHGEIKEVPLVAWVCLALWAGLLGWVVWSRKRARSRR